MQDDAPRWDLGSPIIVWANTVVPTPSFQLSWAGVKNVRTKRASTMIILESTFN